MTLRRTKSAKTKHRGRLWLIFITVSFGAVFICQAISNDIYEQRQRASAEAYSLADTLQQRIDDAIERNNSLREWATAISTYPDAVLVDQPALDQLAADLAASPPLTSPSASAHDALPTAKPVFFWELLAGAEAFATHRAETEAVVTELREAHSVIELAAENLEGSTTQAISAAGGAAETFLANHPFAAADAAEQLRTNASAASTVTTLNQEALDRYKELQQTAAWVIASEPPPTAEEVTKREIEEFSRTLLPSIPITYQWEPLVNGYGEGGSIGGYATWWAGDPGHAVLQFSLSVADEWPSERTRALVAHETGHAATLACPGAYDESNQESIEAWATAWAISRGFTDPTNGVDLYGYPPQELIDIAATCG